ncbi:GHKL domain-containing protein [Fusibacter paucivorans]|uniref:histidine kinase n=1 Tax=Fusibacter paucivorans TaxID=76009 RepID=A0ABS5PNN8_9FIRM|nr:GHKL domain-containing protein [Fusibacter paucivorans]
MFRKLKIRMMLMNLSIITVLMFIVFASIYLITYNKMQVAIANDLTRVASFHRGQPPEDSKPQTDLRSLENTETHSVNEKYPERTVSFTILTDGDRQMLSKNSFFDAEDAFYENALAAADNQQKETGIFSLEGNAWAYLVVNRGSDKLYAFIDITAQQSMLDRLMYTFIAVFVMTFIFIYFISLFLTKRSIQPIKDAFDKQRQFISDASHELKTPLAVIQTNVDVLLQNKKDLHEEDQKWLGYIQSEVQRMSNLTRDLLYLTQMSDDESQQLMHSPFDISDCIEKQMLGLEVVAFEKDIILQYALEPGLMMQGNAEQIAQIIIILMDNAIKYTPPKGQIALQLKQIAHTIQIEITNTGMGISPEDLPYIFDRFYRADKGRSRQNGSYGLGLSIAKAIVERHGGKINCTSNDGGNTQFLIKFKSL